MAGNIESGRKEYDLALTNKEVRLMFNQMIRDWFREYTPLQQVRKSPAGWEYPGDEPLYEPCGAGHLQLLRKWEPAFRKIRAGALLSRLRAGASGGAEGALRGHLQPGGAKSKLRLLGQI